MLNFANQKDSLIFSPRFAGVVYFGSSSLSTATSSRSSAISAIPVLSITLRSKGGVRKRRWSHPRTRTRKQHFYYKVLSSENRQTNLFLKSSQMKHLPSHFAATFSGEDFRDVAWKPWDGNYDVLASARPS